MLAGDPNNRISVQKVITSPWIKAYGSQWLRVKAYALKNLLQSVEKDQAKDYKIIITNMLKKYIVANIIDL